LVLAHEASRYTNILQSTKAVVFFGTPHSGSEQADFLSVLVDIVAKFGSLSMIDRAYGKIRQDLLRTLKPRSVELEALSMSFMERSKELEIVSFYEENAMPPLHMRWVVSLSCVVTSQHSV
jgi:ankyrin repeat domain-containing protein 50